jgi:hypothetical protein
MDERRIIRNQITEARRKIRADTDFEQEQTKGTEEERKGRVLMALRCPGVQVVNFNLKHTGHPTAFF